MSFDECISRSWPGVDDKEAFCAAMHRGELGKILSAGALKKVSRQIKDKEFNLRGDDESDDGVDLRFPIAKRDDSTHTITGWAALSRDASGAPVIDYQGDHIPVAELEKATQQLMADGGGGKAGVMHERRIGDITEMMVVTADKRAALGFGEGPEGLVVSLKIHDEAAWQRVKSGELKELSISGSGERIPVDG